MSIYLLYINMEPFQTSSPFVNYCAIFNLQIVWPPLGRICRSHKFLFRSFPWVLQRSDRKPVNAYRLSLLSMLSTFLCYNPPVGSQSWQSFRLLGAPSIRCGLSNLVALLPRCRGSLDVSEESMSMTRTFSCGDIPQNLLFFISIVTFPPRPARHILWEIIKYPTGQTRVYTLLFLLVPYSPHHRRSVYIVGLDIKQKKKKKRRDEDIVGES